MKRIFAALAAVLFVAAGVLTRPAAAHAAVAPSPRWAGMPVVFGQTDADQGSLIGTLPADLYVGDCVARAGSTIKLASVGAYFQPTWTQLSSTSHTNSADIWHASFRFTDAYGNVLLTVGQLDGAPMSVVNQPYAWVRYAPQVFVSPDRLRSITWVQWYNAC